MRARMILINSIGSLAYLLQFFLWLLLVLLLVNSVVGTNIDTQRADVYLQALHITQTLGSFMLGVGYILAFGVVVGVLSLFVGLPYIVGKWAHIALTRLLGRLRVRRTYLSLLLVKLIVGVLPLLLFMLISLVFFYYVTMLFAVAYISSLLVTLVILLLLCVQMLLARVLKLDIDTIW